MKSNILVMLTGGAGSYRATIYNRKSHTYNDIDFLWYSKKEVFYKLRNHYDCIVSHDFY